MMIVGQDSSTEEAKQMEFISKLLVVGRRAKTLARQLKKEL